MKFFKDTFISHKMKRLISVFDKFKYCVFIIEFIKLVKRHVVSVLGFVAAGGVGVGVVIVESDVALIIKLNSAYPVVNSARTL